MARPSGHGVLGGVRAAVRHWDHRLWRLFGRRIVLVEARTPMNLVVLQPMWEALRRDPRVRVRFTTEAPGALASTWRTHGLEADVVPRAQVAWRRVDLYLNADPWGAVPLRRCARRMIVFHGVAGKYDLDHPERLADAFEGYDRLAFVNEDRRTRYLEAGICTPAQAALVGFPKADGLVDGRHDGAAVRRRLGLAAGRPTVIYAPTFSPASSLHVHGTGSVTRLVEGGFNVIVKLHDRLLDADPKYTGGVDWRAELRHVAPSDRYAFAEGADATPYLVASDALVTDHSSIGFEYMLLDRPVIVLDAPDLLRVARINPEKWALLRSGADVACTLDDLMPAVRDALAAPARLSARRREIAGTLFANPGTATARAVAAVYELLDLAAPLAAPAARRAIEGTAA